MTASNLKLTIELVPSSSWYQNLHKILPKDDWNQLRRSVYVKYNYQCGICESKGKQYCHEEWRYDDQKHIQELTRFISLCELCHHVKHIGLAGVLASRGVLDFDRVVKHFMRVNNCSRQIFQQHYDYAFDSWKQRSKHDWTIEFSKFSEMAGNSQLSSAIFL